MSMEIIIYYMWWLLENYGVHPWATYCVDNRELYFVPIVNPDGYIYNEINFDSSSGWRKNRRPNSDSVSYGVDLNRNYSEAWGEVHGSSRDMSSNTYGGTAAFSEPETRAVRDYHQKVKPSLAFSLHTYGESYLTPWGCRDTAPQFGVYADLLSDFIPRVGNHLYGVTCQLFGYYSCGTTRDYMHTQGTYTWTPELGSLNQGGFWPQKEHISVIAHDNLGAMQYCSWASGAFARIKNIEVAECVPGSETEIIVTVANKGVSRPARNVSVRLISPGDAAKPVGDSLSLGNIEKRSSTSNAAFPLTLYIEPSAEYMDTIPAIVTVRQEGVVTDSDSLLLFVGKQHVIFADDAEQGNGNWDGTGIMAQWNTTSVDAAGKAHGFADSPYGNTAFNTNSRFQLRQPISLVNAQNPYMEFTAKWSIDKAGDYVEVLVSDTGSGNWKAPTGRHTLSGKYVGSSHWIKERIALHDYIGSVITMQFHSYADNWSAGDGFYFDDFRIVDYTEPVAGVKPYASFSRKFGINYNAWRGRAYAFTVMLDKPGHYSLHVYDLSGRTMWRHSGKALHAGQHRIVWRHARNTRGKNKMLVAVLHGRSRKAMQRILVVR
jgi:hypothetical protein